MRRFLLSFSDCVPASRQALALTARHDFSTSVVEGTCFQLGLRLTLLLVSISSLRSVLLFISEVLYLDESRSHHLLHLGPVPPFLDLARDIFEVFSSLARALVVLTDIMIMMVLILILRNIVVIGSLFFYAYCF